MRFFWEYSTPIGLHRVSGCFNALKAVLSSCGRAILGHKAKTIRYLVLSGESFFNTYFRFRLFYQCAFFFLKKRDI